MIKTLLTCARIAARSLFQHRRRNAILVGAIALVTAVLVLLNGLASGIAENMMQTATTLSTGKVNVGGFFKVSPSQFAPVVTDYPGVERVIRRAVPELRSLVRRGRGWAKVVSQTGAMQTGVTGVDVSEEAEFRKVLEVKAGHLPDLAQPGTIVIFEAQAKKLELKVGDAVTLFAQTTKGVANTIDCRVVAIAKDVGILGKYNMFVSNDTLRSLYQLAPTTTGALHLDFEALSPEQLSAIAVRLRKAMEGAGYSVMAADPRPFWLKFEGVSREDWTGQKLDVTTWQDELSFITWTLDLFQALSFVLMLILVSVVVMGILNTMWIVIRERTREIGTLRAIGMQRSAVLLLFLLESLMLGLCGAAFGALLGVGAAIGVNQLEIAVPPSIQLFLLSDHLRVAVHGSAVLAAILLLAAVTCIAAFYPALRAARLRPISAMSHFG
jgi:putative ABC transport system permease protein